MSNLLQRGTIWLGEQLKRAASVTVTYTRYAPEGTLSVVILGTVRMHEYEIVDEEGIATMATTRDYLIHAADLVLNEETIVPRAGDIIYDTVGGELQKYEVLPLGDRGAFDKLDTDDLILAVHTKKVG